MRIFSHGWSDGKDGPGLRYVVYCKGCNLRCLYCANPEGISPEPQALFYPNRVRSVPPEACCHHGLACASCSSFECVKVFHHPAFELAGEDVSAAELIARAEEMRPIIQGVTIGGGEPSLQASEALALIAGLHAAGFHTAVESNASTTDYRRFINAVDLLISDCKAATPEAHRRLTGNDGALVRRNLRDAAREQSDFLVRTVLVPGFNTSDDELRALRDFLAGLRALRSELRVQILRLHHAGAPKYAALGLPEPLADVPPPSNDMQAAFERLLAAEGIVVAPH